MDLNLKSYVPIFTGAKYFAQLGREGAPEVVEIYGYFRFWQIFQFQ